MDWKISENDTLYLKWKDNRIVHMLSTAHGTEMDVTTRRMRDVREIEVSRPCLVKDYNSNMGGVDKADMMRSLYGYDRKSRKWWHRLFWGMIDIAMVNSFTVYSELIEDGHLLDFLRSVATSLLMFTERPRRRSANRNIEAAAHVNRGIHWPQFVATRGRCPICARNGVQSRPKSMCSACKVHLCSNTKHNCFAEYHSAL